MKANFLRNCNNKSEYIYFNSKHSEYLDSYNITVTKTITFSETALKTLEVNTRSTKIWDNVNFKDFYYDESMAYCIRVQDSNFKTHSYVFFNGFNYAKYIAFI